MLPFEGERGGGEDDCGGGPHQGDGVRRGESHARLVSLGSCDVPYVPLQASTPSTHSFTVLPMLAESGLASTSGVCYTVEE